MRRTIIAVLLAGLLALPVGVSPPAAQAAVKIDNSIGFAFAKGQRWSAGCKRYTIQWSWHPPTPDWSVKVEIYAPRDNRRVHHLLYDAGIDPLRGAEKITLCGASIKPGRVKMIATMVYNDGPAGREVHYLRSHPTYWTLKKPKPRR